MKFSSKIDGRASEDRKRIAKESHESVSGLLTEAADPRWQVANVVIHEARVGALEGEQRRVSCLTISSRSMGTGRSRVSTRPTPS